MRFALIGLATLFVTGCAHVDVGQVDYRVADPTKTGVVPNLKSKYLATGLPLEPGEYYSIELEQAVVGPDISEGRILSRNFGSHAEMAILANVFELDATAGEGFVEIPDYDEKAEDGKPRLKLVYYGDNLEKLQPFNFSNMPLLGRRQYNGGRVGLQIVIKEIDGESPAVASLLETLAGYGKTVSPVPQVTDVLLDLGTSLLQGSQDDRLFDYRFTLSSGAAILPNGALDARASFVPGRYILMKDKQRQTEMNWSGLRYDENTGRLRDAAGEFRENMYIVLNVTKYPKNSTAEAFESPDWADFKEKLPKAAADRTIPLAVLEKDFGQMVKSDRSSRLKAGMLDSWMQIDRAIGLYISRSLKDLENTDLSGCSEHKDRLLLQRDLMRRRMSDGAREFLSSYSVALTPTTDAAGQPVAAPFLLKDQEAVVSAISRTFMPWASPALSATFADAAAFRAAYVTPTGGILLADAAAANADSKAPRATCLD